MTYSMPDSNSRLNKSMSQEQFSQIVEAILAGKYSWACVLILRFGGYNPLHYIPYRTYNRLLKENNQVAQINQNQQRHIHDDTNQRDCAKQSTSSDRLSAQGKLSKISDLAYLETVNPPHKQVKGGIASFYC